MEQLGVQEVGTADLQDAEAANHADALRDVQEVGKGDRQELDSAEASHPEALLGVLASDSKYPAERWEEMDSHFAEALADVSDSIRTVDRRRSGARVDLR